MRYRNTVMCVWVQPGVDICPGFHKSQVWRSVASAIGDRGRQHVCMYDFDRLSSVDCFSMRTVYPYYMGPSINGLPHSRFSGQYTWGSLMENGEVLQSYVWYYRD